MAYELRESSYTATNTSMLATALGRTKEYKDRCVCGGGGVYVTHACAVVLLRLLISGSSHNSLHVLSCHCCAEQGATVCAVLVQCDLGIVPVAHYVYQSLTDTCSAPSHTLCCVQEPS